MSLLWNIYVIAHDNYLLNNTNFFLGGGLSLKKVDDNIKCLAKIAKAIYDCNDSVLNVKGVREIIVLYLLIPYMTRDKLQSANGYTIPSISNNDMCGLSIKDLRDSLCHSFVFNCLKDNNNPLNDDYIAFDDRVLMSRSEHNEKGEHNDFYLIPIDIIDAKIEEYLYSILQPC